MQRRLNEVITALPEARRERVQARAKALMSHVEGLGEVQKTAATPELTAPAPHLP